MKCFCRRSAQLGEPESGMDYDAFLCYHVPAGEQDLSVLETLYENPAVTGIRIMENSIYDVARKLHLANYAAANLHTARSRA